MAIRYDTNLLLTPRPLPTTSPGSNMEGIGGIIAPWWKEDPPPKQPVPRKRKKLDVYYPPK
jgi:hypothetical protein